VTHLALGTSSISFHIVLGGDTAFGSTTGLVSFRLVTCLPFLCVSVPPSAVFLGGEGASAGGSDSLPPSRSTH
jgi:hypothetical protein